MRFRAISTRNCPNYQPLSYVWGAPEQTPVAITCNDCQIDIFPSLFTALKYLRDEKEPRKLWADAICINQKNKREKKEQVLLMRHIYEKGEKTVIWLGEPDVDSSDVLEFLDFLVGVKTIQEAFNDTRNYWQMGSDANELYGLPAFSDPVYQAISALLNRPWFTRIWIIQELAVSSDPVVVLGKSQLNWANFVAGVGYAGKLLLTLPEASRRIADLETFRGSISSGKPQPLLDLLIFGRSSSASDNRDKVYALCGMASDCDQDALNIIPDYEVSPEEVYKQVARRILMRSSDLDLLSVSRIPCEPSCYRLPTWVPDWSSGNLAVSVRYPNPVHHTVSNFNAARDTVPSVQISDDVSSVRFQGHFIDAIADIGSERTLNIPNWGSLRAIFSNLFKLHQEFTPIAEWENISQARSKTIYAPTGEDILDAYWQTLVCGHFPEGKNATKQRFAQWDQACAPFRAMPTHPLLRWTLPLFSIRAFINFVRKPRDEDSEELAIGFRKGMELASMQKRLFKTESGWIGMGPSLAQKDDRIALLKGGKVPIVLRRVCEGKQWNLIGDCYLHGAMHGEVFDEEKCQDIHVS